MLMHLISSTKVQQTHIALWDYVGLTCYKPLSVAINSLIASSPYRLYQYNIYRTSISLL